MGSTVLACCNFLGAAVADQELDALLAKFGGEPPKRAAVDDELESALAKFSGSAPAAVAAPQPAVAPEESQKMIRDATMLKTGIGATRTALKDDGASQSEGGATPLGREHIRDAQANIASELDPVRLKTMSAEDMKLARDASRGKYQIANVSKIGGSEGVQLQDRATGQAIAQMDAENDFDPAMVDVGRSLLAYVSGHADPFQHALAQGAAHDLGFKADDGYGLTNLGKDVGRTLVEAGTVSPTHAIEGANLGARLAATAAYAPTLIDWAQVPLAHVAGKALSALGANEYGDAMQSIGDENEKDAWRSFGEYKNLTEGAPVPEEKNELQQVGEEAGETGGNIAGSAAQMVTPTLAGNIAGKALGVAAKSTPGKAALGWLQRDLEKSKYIEGALKGVGRLFSDQPLSMLLRREASDAVAQGAAHGRNAAMAVEWEVDKAVRDALDPIAKQSGRSVDELNKEALATWHSPEARLAAPPEVQAAHDALQPIHQQVAYKVLDTAGLPRETYDPFHGYYGQAATKKGGTTPTFLSNREASHMVEQPLPGSPEYDRSVINPLAEEVPGLRTIKDVGTPRKNYSLDDTLKQRAALFEEQGKAPREIRDLMNDYSTAFSTGIARTAKRAATAAGDPRREAFGAFLGNMDEMRKAYPASFSKDVVGSVEDNAAAHSGPQLRGPTIDDAAYDAQHAPYAPDKGPRLGGAVFEGDVEGHGVSKYAPPPDWRYFPSTSLTKTEGEAMSVRARAAATPAESSAIATMGEHAIEPKRTGLSTDRVFEGEDIGKVGTLSKRHVVEGEGGYGEGQSAKWMNEGESQKALPGEQHPKPAYHQGLPRTRTVLGEDAGTYEPPKFWQDKMRTNDEVVVVMTNNPPPIRDTVHKRIVFVKPTGDKVIDESMNGMRMPRLVAESMQDMVPEIADTKMTAAAEELDRMFGRAQWAALVTRAVPGFEARNLANQATAMALDGFMPTKTPHIMEGVRKLAEGKNVEIAGHMVTPRGARLSLGIGRGTADALAGVSRTPAGPAALGPLRPAQEYVANKLIAAGSVANDAFERAYIEGIYGKLPKGISGEDANRMALYLDGLERGMSPAASARNVAVVLIDMGRENAVTRNAKFFFPFIKYQTGSIRSVARQIANNPRAFSRAYDVQRALEYYDARDKGALNTKLKSFGDEAGGSVHVQDGDMVRVYRPETRAPEATAIAQSIADAAQSIGIDNRMATGESVGAKALGPFLGSATEMLSGKSASTGKSLIGLTDADMAKAEQDYMDANTPAIVAHMQWAIENRPSLMGSDANKRIATAILIGAQQLPGVGRLAQFAPLNVVARMGLGLGSSPQSRTSVGRKQEMERNEEKYGFGLRSQFMDPKQRLMFQSKRLKKEISPSQFQIDAKETRSGQYSPERP